MSDDESEIIIGAKEPRRVNIAESKSGGWSASGLLSRGQNLLQRVNLQAVFPIAGQYTLEFNLFPPTAAIAGATVSSAVATRAVAFITWSVEGNYVTRRMNVSNGASITGVGQGVKVEIYDTTSTADVATYSDNSVYRVSVQVAPGTRANIEQPPVLYRNPGGDPQCLSIAPFSYDTVTIPYTDAGIVSLGLLIGQRGGVEILDSNGSVAWAAGTAPFTGIIPGTVQVIQQQTIANVLASYDPAVMPFWVPLVAGATQVTIANNNANNNLYVTPLFGIDG